MEPKNPIAVVVGVLMVLAAFSLSFKVFCDIDAGEIAVRQSLSGELTVWSDPGWHWQGFGTVTRYPRSEQLSFRAPPEKPEKCAHLKAGEDVPDECKDTTPDESVHVRFNDQGSARLSGSLSFDLPTDEDSMVKIHKKFRAPEAVRARLVRTALVRAAYVSGPFMSSRESAGARRGELSQLIQEQSVRGVFKTRPKEVEVEDYLAPPVKVVEMVEVPVLDDDGKPKLADGKPVTKKEPVSVERPAMKKVVSVEVFLDEKGQPVLQEESPISDLKIRIYNLTVERVFYEDKVQEQINRQRDMEMAIQTKISEAKQAQQDVVTTEKKGQAEAAKAKWDQEVKKAQAMTQAEQEKAVAELKANQAKSVAATDLESAKLERQAAVERAKGESEAKKLIIEADGALAAKLAAYVEVNKAYAAEIGKHSWVPEIVIGEDAKGGGNAAGNLMQLFQTKTARDLALDLGVKK